MKVLVLGGSSFIGHHIVDRCCAQMTAGLADIDKVASVDLYPSESLAYSAQIHLLNVYDAGNDELAALFAEYDVIIDTLGTDDRMAPRLPAYAFFHEVSVDATERLVNLAKQAGIKRYILLSSYLSHLDVLYPELQATELHPCILTRQQQRELVLGAAEENFTVNVLMLPFVFGVTPGIKPVWYETVLALKYLSYLPLPYIKGGGNIVSVLTVAEACVAAIGKGVNGRVYVVGEKNVHWSDLFHIITGHFQRKPKLLKIANEHFSWINKSFQFVDLIRGKETSINQNIVNDLLTHELFVDSCESQSELGYQVNDVDQAIIDTVLCCEDIAREETGKYMKKWMPLMPSRLSY